MNLASIKFRSLLLAVAIVISLVLSGCESDPLLEPQSEVAEEGGSYGNTNLPVSGTGNTANTVKGEQSGKTSSKLRKITNPKLF